MALVDKSFLKGWGLASLAIILIYPFIFLMQNSRNIPLILFLKTIPFALGFLFIMGIFIALILGEDE